ncbi:hypothetical protein LPN01_06270 [Sphingomonas sp. A2-49]|nr:hypothetical protein [Sphingomonas sp. A2-49]MCU6453676.1 hypothetical protein [Sphingomonas sp. A2-49]
MAAKFLFVGSPETYSADAVIGEGEDEAMALAVDPAECLVARFAVLDPVVDTDRRFGIEGPNVGERQPVFVPIDRVFRRVERYRHR